MVGLQIRKKNHSTAVIIKNCVYGEVAKKLDRRFFAPS